MLPEAVEPIMLPEAVEPIMLPEAVEPIMLPEAGYLQKKTARFGRHVLDFS